ncbi:MAG TPA: hypothetical protein VGL38_14780 [bacterium]|jgi:hypothetical protein
MNITDSYEDRLLWLAGLHETELQAWMKGILQFGYSYPFPDKISTGAPHASLNLLREDLERNLGERGYGLRASVNTALSGAVRTLLGQFDQGNRDDTPLYLDRLLNLAILWHVRDVISIMVGGMLAEQFERVQASDAMMTPKLLLALRTIYRTLQPAEKHPYSADMERLYMSLMSHPRFCVQGWRGLVELHRERGLSYILNILGRATYHGLHREFIQTVLDPKLDLAPPFADHAAAVALFHGWRYERQSSNIDFEEYATRTLPDDYQFEVGVSLQKHGASLFRADESAEWERAHIQQENEMGDESEAVFSIQSFDPGSGVRLLSLLRFDTESQKWKIVLLSWSGETSQQILKMTGKPLAQEMEL